MAEGDAAGGRDSGGPNCGGDEVYDKDGVSDGAVGTETDDQPGTAWKDGAGAGMRSGIRVGAVAPLAGGSGDGTCGTGIVEEEVYGEEDREQGNEGTREQGGRRVGGLANQQVSKSATQRAASLVEAALAIARELPSVRLHYALIVDACGFHVG